MDTTASVKQEAQPAGGGASTTSSLPEVRPAAPSKLAVAGGAAEESGDGVGEDEQVERFYALLANIRALRDVYGAGWSSRKRPRVAEPPWRPRFRMEDFREVDDAVPTKKERRDDCVERQRPESGDDAADHEGEVVEENDRVSASQSTRARTDSA
ncbi:hypothetical protein QYE76_013849 [Lolium multiflorum]|uniref:Uncharacterized protein n=1 Tax=Lolium multiflorum TaxID=4521 RepID=A0AAD8U3R7_LOLMU|nr:hypothetical protein QYE76_013849 [Lolium multiflorum]